MLSVVLLILLPLSFGEIGRCLEVFDMRFVACLKASGAFQTCLVFQLDSCSK